MKTASIVSIGNEVLSGLTIDTNAAFLSQQLLPIGILVVSSYTAGDTIESIVRSLNRAAEDADVILTTGGLGPTDDDLTRQAFAQFLQVELKFSEELFERIRIFFFSRARQMSETNTIQAYIPEGAKALDNNLGTAPGIIIRQGDKLLAAMPGVPSEMKSMFKESILPELQKLAGRQAIVVKRLKCFGTGESNVAQTLGNLMERGRNPTINCTVSCGVITFHIVAIAEDEVTAKKLVEKDEKMLHDLLGDLVYGHDDQSLAEVVGSALATQNKTIAVAESCTGGLLAKLITDIPGSSRYFSHGWVTYSNEAKVSRLSVPEELIEKYGAVSEQVAEAMARGALRKSAADFAIGITGIAGPGGGTEQKNVGLVYIAVCSGQRHQTKRFVFSHDREFIRLLAAQTALNMLRLMLGI